MKTIQFKVDEETHNQLREYLANSENPDYQTVGGIARFTRKALREALKNVNQV